MPISECIVWFGEDAERSSTCLCTQPLEYNSSILAFFRCLKANQMSTLCCARQDGPSGAKFTLGFGVFVYKRQRRSLHMAHHPEHANSRDLL
jgi:hypothetical protein